MPNFYNDVVGIQDTIDKVITAEQTRIDAKKKGIMSAYNTQQRNIILNQSYASRMRAWSYLITIVSVAIVISIILMNSRNIIPSTVVDILIIVVMAGAIIWAYLVYVDIQKRDRNDYTLLSTDSGNLVDPTTISQGATNSAALIAQSNANANNVDSPQAVISSSSTTCIGAQCCPANWDGTKCP